MSPKKITQLAMGVGIVSIFGGMAMLALQPGWGIWQWWPLMGLGLSLLLFVAAFFKGAYLASQQRVAMVDKLNDCYTGTSATEVE
jgi:hypothetical protein